MKYKKGDFLIIWSMLSIVQIESVRQSGNLLTLWVKHKDSEFPINAIIGSDVFVLKHLKYIGKSYESKVTKLSSFITGIGIILALLISLYFLGL